MSQVITDPEQLYKYKEYNLYKEARLIAEKTGLIPSEILLTYDKFEDDLINAPMSKDSPWHERNTRHTIENLCIGAASEILVMSYCNHTYRGLCTKTVTQLEDAKQGIDIYLPPNEHGNRVPVQIKTTRYNAKFDTFYAFDAWAEKTGALRHFLVDPESYYMIMVDYGRLCKITSTWTQRAYYTNEDGTLDVIKLYDIPGSLIHAPDRIIDLNEFFQKLL